MHDDIMETFNALKKKGLEAKNPDQSAAAFWSFKELVKDCRWRGFSEKDIDLLFSAAKETP